MTVPIRVVGIDPGTHTGLADVRDGEFLLLEETTFWGAWDYVHSVNPDLIVIEVATDTNVWQDNARKARARKAMRVAQDVGAVRREGQLLAEGLRRQGFNVKTVPPRGKMSAGPFSMLTGYEGRTNPHKRDAGMLAWNEYQALKQRERATA